MRPSPNGTTPGYTVLEMSESSNCFPAYSFYHRKHACCSWADFNRLEIKLRHYLKPNQRSRKTSRSVLSWESKFCGEKTRQGISERKTIHNTLTYRKNIYLKWISCLFVWTLEDILGVNRSNLSTVKTNPDLGSQTGGLSCRQQSLCT